jgi:hypothetical protein
VKGWIENNANCELPYTSSGILDKLSNGVILCKVINSLGMGKLHTLRLIIVDKIQIYKGKLHYKHVDNIIAFLETCKHIGLKEHQLFEVNDLYSKINFVKVIFTLGALQTFFPDTSLPPVSSEETEQVVLSECDYKHLEEYRAAEANRSNIKTVNNGDSPLTKEPIVVDKQARSHVSKVEIIYGLSVLSLQFVWLYAWLRNQSII